MFERTGQEPKCLGGHGWPGEAIITVGSDDFGNHDVVAAVPALVLALCFGMLRVRREFAHGFERLPAVSGVRRPAVRVACAAAAISAFNSLKRASQVPGSKMKAALCIDVREIPGG